MRQNESDFEKELEQSLAAYTDPGDTGHPQVLTARVLAAVDGQRKEHRWWLGLGVALPAFACLVLVAIVVLWQPEHPLQPAEIAAAPSSAPASAATVPALSTAGTPKERTHAQVARNLAHQQPKLDQFPAPAPLTEQERLLVSFASQTSPDTQQAIVQAQQQSGLPLHIAELSIPPLNVNTQP
jgi:hypothetical protein